MGVFQNLSVSPAAKGKILTGNEQERAELGRKAGLRVGRDDSMSLKTLSLQYKFGNALVSPEVMEKWADGARSHPPSVYREASVSLDFPNILCL